MIAFIARKPGLVDFPWCILLILGGALVGSVLWSPTNVSPPESASPAEATQMETVEWEGLREFAFVVQEAERVFLVLDEEPLGEEWEPVELELLRREISVWAWLDETMIGAKDLELVEQEFVLGGVTGPWCRARATAIGGLSRVDDAYHTGNHILRPDSPDSEFAETLWRYGQRYLVLELEVQSGECRGVMWGRDGRLEPAGRYSSRDVTPVVKEELTELFRGLAGYKEVQRDFVEYEFLRHYGAIDFDVDRVGDWIAALDGEVRMTKFIEPRTMAMYVQVFARAEPGCGAFNGEFWAIFRKEKSGGEWEVVTDPLEPGPAFFAVTAFDATGAGTPQFLSPGGQYTSYFQDYDRQLVEFDEGRLVQTRATTFPFFGCRC